jgi:serine/threonine-protein kinase RsbW
MKEGYTLIDSLTIPSDVSKLPVVETLIDSVCQSIGVHEVVYGNVLIAVTEAVNNAILHGNKNDVSLNVGVNVFDAPVSFCFNVSDTGNGFDYDSLPDPTAPENIEKENGRGVFLMRNLADDVVYNETGNQVFVYFNKE